MYNDVDDEFRHALSEHRNDHALTLLSKLSLCGDDGAWGGQYRCRAVACKRCLRLYTRKQQRALRGELKGVSNASLAFLSLVIGATIDVTAIVPMFRAFSKDLRNVIDKCRRRSPRWNDFTVTGWLETDAFFGNEYGNLGADKRSQLGDIWPVFYYSDEPVWVVTTHALVKLGKVDLHETERIFKDRWRGARQLDIRQFITHKTEDENIDSTVGYALKNRCTINVNGFKDKWPYKWRAAYYTMLEASSTSFKSIKFAVGEKGVRNGTNVDGIDRYDIEQEDIEPMPFVCLFSN